MSAYREALAAYDVALFAYDRCEAAGAVEVTLVMLRQLAEADIGVPCLLVAVDNQCPEADLAAAPEALADAHKLISTKVCIAKPPLDVTPAVDLAEQAAARRERVSCEQSVRWSSYVFCNISLYVVCALLPFDWLGPRRGLGV